MFFYVSLETLPFYTPYPSILLEEAPPKDNNIKEVVLILLSFGGQDWLESGVSWGDSLYDFVCNLIRSHFQIVSRLPRANLGAMAMPTSPTYPVFRPPLTPTGSCDWTSSPVPTPTEVVLTEEADGFDCDPEHHPEAACSNGNMSKHDRTGREKQVRSRLNHICVSIRCM